MRLPISWRTSTALRTSLSPSRSREEPEGFFNLGGRLFFSTADPDSLDQGILWGTDGTAAGTQQVSAALCAAKCQSLDYLATWHGAALLRVVTKPGDPFSRSRLARTDGTASGTYSLTGDFDSDYYETPLDVHPLPDAGDFLFAGCLRETGCRLWHSDGTPAGTGVLLGTDALPLLSPHAFALWRGRLYFVAVHGAGGEEGLWSTDGTPAGTLFLHAVQERADAAARTAATASHLFFTSGETSEDLWATDGSPAGTLRVADFAPQPCADGCILPDVDSLTASGDRVYFETHRAGHAIEIWESDGTTAGTRPRIELPARVVGAEDFQRVGGHWLFLAGTEDQPPVLWTVDDSFTRTARLTACGGGICPAFDFSLSPPGGRTEIFAGFDNLHGLEPWVTDGTAAGTRRLADIFPGPGDGISFDVSTPHGVPGPGGTLLFHAYAPESDVGTGEDEIWSTDGTPAGTRRIAVHSDGFGVLNGVVFYGSSFGNGGQGHLGSELWATDGTPGNTRRIALLRRFEAGSAPALQPFQDSALILTAKADGQTALWRSDGTPAGTFALHDFSATSQKAYTGFIGPVGSSQLFSLYVQPDDLHRPAKSEIWRTDGTPEGTRAIAELAPSGFVEPPIAWRGQLVFNVYSPEGCTLWSSDGSGAGTHPILPTASVCHCPRLLTALGSGFLYSATPGDSQTQSRLFLSDGTPPGTREIARLGGVLDQPPLRIGGTVFFRVVSDPSPELWQTDGTAGGTRRASTLTDPSDLQEFDGSLYLTAALSADPNAGRALFQIPLAGGTPLQLAKLFQFSPASIAVPVQFSAVGERLFFTVQDIYRGFEAWSTDGTPAGTRLIHRFQPTPNPFREPELLAGTGDRAFFAASDGVHGRELWASDGTPEGTRMVTDLAPGGFSSMPQNSSFAVANGFLFFSADDSKTGLEPWALPLEPR